MIPKIIHYCWFGGKPLPKSAIKCINSWKKFFPDYEIKEWNESNFDVNMTEYTQYCYSHKLWAYLSDFARLYVVEKEGGLYFDTDVEVVRGIDSIEKLMSSMGATAFFGFETSNFVASGLGFGSEAHHPALKEMIRRYVCCNGNGVLCARLDKTRMVGCPAINTDVFIPHGLEKNGLLQCCMRTLILPPEYMCPLETTTGVLSKTDNTFSIHWFTMSAVPRHKQIRVLFTRPIRRLLQKVRLIKV